MSNQKVDALNQVVQRLNGVKQVLVNVELGQKPVESYEAINDVNNSIEILEIIKASIFWEDAEREALSLAPTTEEKQAWDLDREEIKEDPRVQTKLSFLDIEQLQYFVAEYNHYREKDESILFLTTFIEDYSLDHLDRVKYDLERNRNESLAGVNYNLEDIYKHGTDLIDEIVEKINFLIAKSKVNTRLWK